MVLESHCIWSNHVLSTNQLTKETHFNLQKKHTFPTHPLKSPHLSPTNYQPQPQGPPPQKNITPTGWCSISTGHSPAKHLFGLIQRCKKNLFGRQSFISKRRFQGAQVVGSNGHLTWWKISDVPKCQMVWCSMLLPRRVSEKGGIFWLLLLFSSWSQRVKSLINLKTLRLRSLTSHACFSDHVLLSVRFSKPYIVSSKHDGSVQTSRNVHWKCWWL